MSPWIQTNCIFPYFRTSYVKSFTVATSQPSQGASELVYLVVCHTCTRMTSSIKPTIKWINSRQSKAGSMTSSPTAREPDRRLQPFTSEAAGPGSGSGPSLPSNVLMPFHQHLPHQAWSPHSQSSSASTVNTKDTVLSKAPSPSGAESANWANQLAAAVPVTLCSINIHPSDSAGTDTQA